MSQENLNRKVLLEGLNLPKQEKPYDFFSNIIAYEDGELDDQGIIELFAHLIKTGQAWTLQGHYGRTAESLIDQGIISDKGKILMNADEL